MKEVINIENTNSISHDYLLFDIETTGLSRTKNYMYMFGICQRKDTEMIYSQYYVDNEDGEIQLIEKINELLKGKKIISYNGDRFDLPFIRKRAEIYGIKLENIENRDIYREMQKLNFFLNESSLKAINLGQRLGMEVHDHVTQRETLDIFKMYSELKDRELLAKLIYHNYIDLKVLSKIYEYKINVLEKLLYIKNKNFEGIIENIYLQNDTLVIKLKNINNILFEFNHMNYQIHGDKSITVKLELEYGNIDSFNKGYIFKASKFSNRNFKYSSNLKNNGILIIKDKKIIRENLLLLLNLL